MSLNPLLLDSGRDLVIRFATEGDADAERAATRLAQLDSARPPSGPLLVAERGGLPVAARSLADGRVVADPFERTADAVALLHMRAAQLSSPRRSGRGALGRLSSPAGLLRRRARAS